MFKRVSNAPAHSLKDSNANPKVETKEKKNRSTFLSSQYFEGRRACWSSRMRTRMNDKQVNYFHEFT